ncbi:MAG: hypothetical protein WEE64_08025 [Dehalococcoidia bacterium]
MRQLLERRRFRALGALALGVAAALGLWFVLSAQLSPPATIEDEAPTSGPSLDTLLAEDFGDLELTALATDAVSLSREEAERVVEEEAPFDGVREAKLARVESGWYECPSGCNAWIFSMDVSEIPHHRFFVALIDADTGDYLTGIGACYNSAGDSCP